MTREPGRELARVGSADLAAYEWQTGEGYYAESEQRLIELAALPTHGRVLEIGCGSGANLVHLGARDGWVGVDLARGKLAHAQRELPALHFTCADATRLPFASRSFDAVLVRDVLHLARDRVSVLSECWRVLDWGGALGVIEPNRQNPMVLAQALFVGAERSGLSSDEPRLRRDLANAGFCGVSLTRAQPMPLARLGDPRLLPRLGLSALARRPGLGRPFAAADRALERLVPEAMWMYIVARARKPG
jgi:SAM-dependent methyltransferase